MHSGRMSYGKEARIVIKYSWMLRIEGLNQEVSDG